MYYELTHAIGGGYLFRNDGIIKVPEGATRGLKVYAVYRAQTMNRSAAVQSFLDYMYNDIVSLSKVDYQEFNLFKSFTISPSSASPDKKSFPLSELLNFKELIQGELRGAIFEKQKITLKLWLRVKNLSSIPIDEFAETFGEAKTMVVGEADYIYVLTEKVYILHLLEGTVVQSFSHAPLCALAEGIFQRKESAMKYAQIYGALPQFTAG